MSFGCGGHSGQGPPLEADENLERDERFERELGVAGVAQRDARVHDGIPPHPPHLADRTLGQYEEIRRRRTLVRPRQKTGSRPPRQHGKFRFDDAVSISKYLQLCSVFPSKTLLLRCP